MGLNFPQWFLFSYCLNINNIFKHSSITKTSILFCRLKLRNTLIEIWFPFAPLHHLHTHFCCDSLPLPEKKLQKGLKMKCWVRSTHCTYDWLNGEKQSKMIWMHRNTYFSTMSNAQPSIYCPLLSRGNNDDDEQQLLLQMETNDISHQQTAQPFRLSMSP